MKEIRIQRKWSRLPPERILALGFLLVIIVGAILLSLPMATVSGERLSLIDAVFMATSAVCVTGLSVVDVGTFFTYFGQIVIMLLIQIGALGFMTMTTLIALVLGRKIGLKERIVIQESFNSLSTAGAVRLTMQVLVSTAIIEGIGALVLFLRFLPTMPAGKAFFFGVFHAISAFANAGFDLNGNFNSFTIYTMDPVINLVLPALFILGGLGFHVLYELYTYPKTKNLSLHSKIVLFMTLILIVLGVGGFMTFEWTNPNSLQPLSTFGKLMASWFQGVTGRTAGFSTLDFGVLRSSTLLLTMILMFIGASPGGTGGGVKTTTIACLLLAVRSELTGRHDIEIFKRRIAFDTVFRALAITVLAFFLCLFVVVILTYTEPFDFMDICFETISAFGTVGLSTGITPHLRGSSRVLLSILMYVGRLGPITLGFALARRKVKLSRRFAEEKIIVG